MNELAIVCVDDEPLILEVLKAQLKRYLGKGYYIELAESGEEALSIVEELQAEGIEISLVISDQIMPGMRGDELLIQMHSRYPKTLKILLTGQASADAVGNAVNAANLYRYITKPWDQTDLCLTVAEALRRYVQDKQLAEQNQALQKINHELAQLNASLEQKVADRTAELAKSQEKFAKAFRSSPSAITIVRQSDGCHIEVNDSFCNFIGYTREEIIGRTALDLNLWVKPEARAQLFQILQEKGTIRNYEFDYRNKFGTVLTALLSAELIELDGQTCVIAVSQDISDRKQAEIAMREAKEAAIAANRAKSTFLANMSHELRSPLNAILGFSQLMTRRSNLPSEHQENLGIITRSGEHLLTLINNVLDLSKIEAGRMTLNEQNFDLYRLLDDLEDMFQLRADDKRLQLVFDRSPDVPQYIRTDAVKLRQVLINLLDNAIRFTSHGGVSLYVRSTHFSADESAKALATNLYFAVEDTGPGITPDELNDLFKAFVQTKAGQQSQQGTGLGLPISRSFVQLMGGEFAVSSEVGKGTRFEFNIQVSAIAATEIETKQPTRRVIALEPDQPTYRILVVDDKWSSRRLLIKLLSPLGFELQEASNGIEAIAIWDRWEPHLIWMDMRMPLMDGYEATKHIKATTKGQATAVIALSASTLEEERAVVLSAGCDDFLRKPFREADIFNALNKHLGVRYIYDEPTSSQASAPDSQDSQDSQDALTPSALASLPTELLTDLEQATIRINLQQISQLIEQIRTHNAALASALATKVKNFQYAEVLGLIQNVKTQNE